MNYLAIAQRTFKLEIDALAQLSTQLDKQFNDACELILNCTGRVIIIGMGKSGLIGNKIAATFSSTGTPSLTVHPGEASHGDMGMITQHDLVIAISNSGEVNEVTSLLPLIKRLGVPLIAMTGKPSSTLALASNVHLFCGVKSEACPLNLAPTSSTTATLVMGDALAIALMEARGFTAEDFAFSHPGGSLGKKLLLKVEDIMSTHDRIPLVSANCSISEALLEMTQKGFGIAIVVKENALLGVFTDGDLRRIIKQNINFSDIGIETAMNKNPLTIGPKKLAAEALYVLEKNKITALVVVNDHNLVEGIIHMHDILRAGVA